MPAMNNINVSMLTEAAEEAKSDQSRARRTQKIEGEWLLKEGVSQGKTRRSREASR